MLHLKRKVADQTNMNTRDERALVNMVRINRSASSGELKAKLHNTGVDVSASVIRKQLQKLGHKACRPRKKLLLTKKKDVCQAEVGKGAY